MSRHNRDSRRKSYNIPGHAHELTFSCYKRYPFLGAERCCQWLAEAVGKARASQQFRVWAFVFMPDHAHLIIYPYASKYKMSRILEAIKQPVGAKAIAYLKETNSD
jgi:putative transposase